MLGMQMPSAGAMPHPASVAGHGPVRQDFSQIILPLLRRVLDPVRCCTRLNCSPSLAVMGVRTEYEIVLAPNRGVAEQAPPDCFAPIIEEVLKHVVHICGNTDWHFDAMVAH